MFAAGKSIKPKNESRYIMSASMKMRHTNKKSDVIQMYHAGVTYQFPTKVAEAYRLSEEAVNTEEIFSELNAKHTKPGALLRGIRIRENLTQTEMAKLLSATQSDISQMENGTRNIGRKIAQRIEKLFEVDYRSFLA